ncbi:RNA polymerase subunit sigma [Bacillus sp. T33-2]|nr:RNA polymerase subunit sigma [Bacillus sp. T33-2]
MEFYPGLQRYCRFIAQNKWDGDDLAQEAMLKALQHYKNDHSMVSSALLNKIAYHNWIDTLRKRKREVSGLQPEAIENEPASPDGLIDTVNLLMNQLTPKQAVVLMLKEAFHYQAREIADLLKTRETAVKSILHRAKKRLSREDAISATPFWDQTDRDTLFDLLYKTLQTEDPKELINRVPEIPSLAGAPKLVGAMHSSSPLSSFCMAA